VRDLLSEGDPEYNPSTPPSTDTPILNEGEISEDQQKIKEREDTVAKILAHPKNFLGISPNNLKVVDLLASKLKSKTAKTDVLLTLRKIKKNESYTDLQIYFCWDRTTIARKIKRTLPVIAKNLRTFVYRPSAEAVLRNLPQAFRYSYSDTSEIIDCFEIEIAKPGAAYLQNLTYSSYKHCNTIKILIAVTPEGFVSWFSKAYCGRISDVSICKCSGYFASLREGMCILADRGFKHLAPELDSLKCKLVRPPSVAQNEILTRSANAETKKIASLRIHVERLIQRVRQFKSLAPHSLVALHFVPQIDDVVAVACGLVNLMDPLIRV
jgi:hypothetical protein